MTLSRGPHQPKMSASSTGKSSGWTAFHQKQLQGQDVGTKSEVDIYPPLLSSSSSTPPSRSGTLAISSFKNKKSDKNGFYKLNDHSATSSFSSAAKSSLDAMPLINHCNNGAIDPSLNKHISNGTIRSMATDEKERAEKFEKLRQINSWADDTLIQDILAAVDNNEDRASMILRRMDLSANPLSTDKENSNSKMNITDHEERNRTESIEQLKERHIWADDALIEDILVSVGGNKDQASLILVSMCRAGAEAEDFGDNCGDTTLSGGPRQPKISAWSTGSSSGWTAFHQKHPQGHNVGTKSKVDIYPPLLTSSSSTRPSWSGTLASCSSKNRKSDKNGFCDYKVSEYPATSSSSIVNSSLVAMPLINNSNNGAIDPCVNKHISNGTIRSRATEEKKRDEKFSKLRQINSWADDTLIEDILAAVHNNEERASMILRSMDLYASSPSTDKEHSNREMNITNHEEINRAESVEQLKERHIWADDALIEDILVAVGGNEDQASLILISMCPTGYEAEDFSDNCGDTTLSGEPCEPKMSAWSTGRSSGWTAFHQKHLQGHNVGTKSKVDIYPPLISSSLSIPPSQSGTLAPCSSKNQKSDKNGIRDYKLSEYPATSSFSSIANSSLVAMPLIDNSNIGAIDPSVNKHISNGTIRSRATEEKKRAEKFEKLRQINSWADDTLIEDILAAVDNNEDRASMILRSMDLYANSPSTDKEHSNRETNITNHEEINRAESIEQLKERHIWADNALIEDILVAVGGNEDQASLILISMCPTGYEAEDFGDNFGDTTLSGEPCEPKMSAWSTGRSSGWTAFHQKQLQGHNVRTKPKVDIYPPLISSSLSIPPSRSGILGPCPSKNQKSDKNGIRDYKISEYPATSSFSSIVKSSVVAMTLTDHSNNGAIDLLANKHTHSGMIEKLRQINSWADDTLIEDILAAVGNNEDQASMILRSMDLSAKSLSTDKDNSNGQMNIMNYEERNRAKSIAQLKKLHTWANDALMEDILSAVGDNEEQASLLLISMCPTGSEAEETAKRDDLECSSVKNLKGVNQLSVDVYRKKAPLVEPEWEQDDIYLSHRKDAIKMMRLASLHSRGARSAFSVGDHFHARQLSQRARGEWLAAEKLNQKAAQEILHLRNKGNDIWKLDLHGLHASEAVEAVEAHLESIESSLMTKDSVCSAKIINGKGALRGLSAECAKSSDKGAAPEKIRLQVRSSRPQRQTMLEVITGTGKHSRGNAALPAAIRSFLLTNGYHFYDARPGVIAVRPKFRHK
ncbi:uncharacterized protein LOC116258278 isoform X2 [Nymphaea colorata]|uniref:uncharacterized protein LOC116258278 isoform X2 n=1 Tax=Nymphaea colorata TaxID=210225 RepID=UPI00129D6E2B|nr:uncharacterized protein LOC116258278 isoform X2 [Nymphaea colorata]